MLIDRPDPPLVGGGSMGEACVGLRGPDARSDLVVPSACRTRPLLAENVRRLVKSLPDAVGQRGAFVIIAVTPSAVGPVVGEPDQGRSEADPTADRVIITVRSGSRDLSRNQALAGTPGGRVMAQCAGVGRFAGIRPWLAGRVLRP